MFSISNIVGVPFTEKGAIKSWDIQKGYETVCCEISGSTGSGISDLLLAQILVELEEQNLPVNSITFTTTVNGVIPAGVQSYSIINLGSDPSDITSDIFPMFVDGVEYSEKFVRYGNSTGTHQVLANAVIYIPNGNTLAIIYNQP